VHPAIYGGDLVWEDDRYQPLAINDVVFLYDIAAGQQTQLINDSNDQVEPAIYGDRIVWRNNRMGAQNIHTYGISAGTDGWITNDSSDKALPTIYGDRVVWQDKRNGNWDVYLYDLLAGEETLITNSSSRQQSPAIYGDRIMWEDYRNGNADIYMYDLATQQETRITNDSANQLSPSIYGDRIVWQDTRNGMGDIYLYDVVSRTETRLTTDSGQQSSPSIYGDRIVWEDYRLGNADIYLYDLSTNQETRITNDAQSQWYPSIYGDRIVWQDDRNGNWDIYLSTYIPENMTKPGSLILRGDADGDGNLTMNDFWFLSNYTNSGGPAPNPEILGDIDTDGVVDTTDFQLLFDSLNGNFTIPPEYFYGYSGIMLRGDVDGNGSISMADLDFLTPMAFENYPPPEFYSLADAKPDGGLNIGDVIDLKNFIGGFGTIPVPIMRGDVNGNGIFNFYDVGYLEAFLNGSGPAPKDDILADVNGDRNVTSEDVDYLIAYLAGFGPAPVGPLFTGYVIPTPTPAATVTSPPGGGNPGGGNTGGTGSNPGGGISPRPSAKPSPIINASPKPDARIQRIPEVDELLLELKENGADTLDVEEKLSEAKALEEEGNFEESSQIRLGMLARLKVMLANLKSSKANAAWMAGGIVLLLILAGVGYYLYMLREKEAGAERKAAAPVDLPPDNAAPREEKFTISDIGAPKSSFDEPEIEPIKLDLRKKA